MIEILGGGPAGAAASLLLARWGHEVRLTTRSTGRRSLAVAILELCEALRRHWCRRRGRTRRLPASRSNTVWVGSADARVEPFAVARSDAARRRRAGRRDSRRNDRRRRTSRTDAGLRAGAAPDAEGAVTLDCTGRAGMSPACSACASSTRATNRGARWRLAARDGWHARRHAHPDRIVRERVDVVRANRRRRASHRGVVDPRRSGVSRAAGAAEIYLAEIGKTRVFKALIEREPC